MYFVYDADGIANSVEEINGKKYRVRVETLIIKDNKVYLYKTGALNQYGRYYKIPGGSIEPGLSLAESARKECREECRAEIKNVKRKGKYITEYKMIPEWHKKILWPIGLKYSGSITYVFVAEYKGMYNGYIKKQDIEPGMFQGGKWYDLNDYDLSPLHKKILASL